MATSDHEFNLGIIGGGVAVQMALPALSDLGKVAIHFLPDTQNTYQQFYFMESLDEILDPRRIGALYVATPVTSHLEIAARAAKLGIPTLVEKPLCATIDGNQEVDPVTSRNTVIAFRKRFSEVALAIRDTRDLDPHANSVIHIVWLAPHPGVGHWKSSPRHVGGGVALDLASHVIDLLEHCVAPVVELFVLSYKLCETSGSDLFLELKFRLKDGTEAFVNLGWAVGDPVQMLTLHHGSEHLYWNKDANSPESVLYTTSGASSRRIECRRLHEYQRMFGQFTSFAKTGNRGDLASWDDGVRNVSHILRIFDQIYAP